jgi:hypothetical protein
MFFNQNTIILALITMIMSKFLPERKKLLEEAFEKASSETPETSFSGILKNLEIVLRDDYKIILSYKTFENYYKAIVREEGDYPIKPAVLDDLSRYLGFDSFNDYCSGWKSFEYMINQALSKLVITVINKPIIKMPEFFTKQSSMGIFGVLLICGFFAGNKILAEQKGIRDSQEKISGNEEIIIKKPNGIIGNHLEKKYMYWENDKYIGTDSAYINPGIEVIAMNKSLLLHLKKINRPDTLTIENSKGKVWYDKSDNNVEFFTSPGIHPENGKALKDVSETIINNHAGLEDE